MASLDIKAEEKVNRRTYDRESSPAQAKKVKKIKKSLP